MSSILLYSLIVKLKTYLESTAIITVLHANLPIVFIASPNKFCKY